MLPRESDPQQDWSAERAVESPEPQAFSDSTNRVTSSLPEFTYSDNGSEQESLLDEDVDEIGMVSYTENARINAWKTQEAMKKASNSGIPSRVGSATSRVHTNGGGRTRPPPQRPSSPSHPCVVPFKRADMWLAGGRDFNSMNMKRISVPLPGWMEGLKDNRRPKSSPATAPPRFVDKSPWQQGNCNLVER